MSSANDQHPAFHDGASDAAAAWVARLAAHDVSDSERAAFRVWHAQSGVHRAEFDTMMAVWTRLDVLEHVPVDVPQRRHPYSRMVRFAWPWAAAAAVLGLVALLRFSQNELTIPSRVDDNRRFSFRVSDQIGIRLGGT